MAHQNDDFLDDLLTLEDKLHTTAHDQGVSDGARAGRIEGRIFGLEKGFEKFAALGELHGRGAVWGSRLPPAASSSTPASSITTPTRDPTKTAYSVPESTTSPNEANGSVKSKGTLPPLSNTSTRLQTNISLLYHLTDPLTFSTANTEADVGDFDDRFKRAGAKAKVIERIIGETFSLSASTSTKDAKSPERGNAKGRNVRLEGEGKRGVKKGDDSMEDFGGSRLIR